MTTSTLSIFLAITLILWGVSHFDLPSSTARLVSIATGIFAILSGIILIYISVR